MALQLFSTVSKSIRKAGVRKSRTCSFAAILMQLATVSYIVHSSVPMMLYHLPAAGHVSARFFADSRDVIEGRGWKVCVSTLDSSAQ